MILTPSKNFRLKKQYKRILATIIDRHERGALKRMFIQGQLQSEIQPPKEKRSRDGQRGE